LNQAAELETRETSVPEALVARLACPACTSSELVQTEENHIQCTRCRALYPLYAGGTRTIPWVYQDPDSTLLEWKTRFNGFLHSNWNEQNRLRKALKSKSLSPIARNRLELMLEARMTQRIQVSEILSPLDLECVNFDRGHDPASLLRSRLPGSQGVSSYYNNIFRDWSWNNGENEQQLAAVQSVIAEAKADSLGHLLTIGAGAGRLAYDLHVACAPELSVALDINPLLMFLASRVVSGETVSMVEFPTAPLTESAFAVQQECRAPAALPTDRFAFMFADGLNPPLADSSFDTIVTPWMVDIIPQNLRDFALTVNRLLDDGGLWINTGSLAFFHKDPTWCYSEVEVLELAEECGFEILATERRQLPYLQSPHSAYWRTENALTFCARKKGTVEETRHFRYVPEWMVDSTCAVPSRDEFSVCSSDHLLRAQILAAVDGQRSIDDIAASLAREYGLRQLEAKNAVRRIILEVYENHVLQQEELADALKE
jgi:Carnosine N-methyltransferase